MVDETEFDIMEADHEARIGDVEEAKEDLRIVEFNEFELKLTEFMDQYKGLVYDLNDKKQDKKARSDKYAIGKVISALDKKHKELKAPIMERTKLLDDERKRIKDSLKSIQDDIKGQIEKHEEAIRKKAADLQEKVSNIVNIGIWDADLYLNSTQLKARLEQVEAVVIDDSFEDRKGDAALAKDEVIQKLKQFIVDAEAYEAEQAKAEEERKAQEEAAREAERKRIEQEAAEKAEREAKAKIEEAERRAKEAEERAAMDASEKEKQAQAEAEKAKREAEEAKLQAAKAAQEAEAKAKAEKEEKERAETEAKAKREADEKHRSEVNAKAIEAISNWGINPMIAENVVQIIAKGAVPGITINY